MCISLFDSLETNYQQQTLMKLKYGPHYRAMRFNAEVIFALYVCSLQILQYSVLAF